MRQRPRATGSNPHAIEKLAGDLQSLRKADPYQNRAVKPWASARGKEGAFLVWGGVVWTT